MKNGVLVSSKIRPPVSSTVDISLYGFELHWHTGMFAWRYREKIVEWLKIRGGSLRAFPHMRFCKVFYPTLHRLSLMPSDGLNTWVLLNDQPLYRAFSHSPRDRFSERGAAIAADKHNKEMFHKRFRLGQLSLMIYDSLTRNNGCRSEECFTRSREICW